MLRSLMKEERRKKEQIRGDPSIVIHRSRNAFHGADNKLRVFIHVLGSRAGRNAIGRSVIPRASSGRSVRRYVRSCRAAHDRRQYLALSAANVV